MGFVRPLKESVGGTFGVDSKLEVTSAVMY